MTKIPQRKVGQGISTNFSLFHLSMAQCKYHYPQLFGSIEDLNVSSRYSTQHEILKKILRSSISYHTNDQIKSK